MCMYYKVHQWNDKLQIPIFLKVLLNNFTQMMYQKTQQLHFITMLISTISVNAKPTITT